MELDRLSYDRARRSRDARFDGRFFVAVKTTGIYCRPICPARTPKDENVRYFESAAAAEAAGFRPCLRCRPEAAPGSPAWNGTSGVVSRALRLIGEGALDGDGVERLAERVGVTGRHLRRLFRQHLGATPLEVALTRRVHFAKKLLDETGLGLEEIAFASGFGSLRRFNARIRRTFRRTPTELRRRARSFAACEPECYRFRLAYRAPYDWEGMLRYLDSRAIAGVESVDGSTYRRTIAVKGRSGVIEVSLVPGSRALSLSVRFPDPRALLLIVERVRRIFDVGADPKVVAEHLGLDPRLRALLAKSSGIRIPGAWDGFELAVAAVLGRRITRQVAAELGSPLAAGRGLERLFPTPQVVAQASLERAGPPPSRAAIVRSLAREVASGRDLLSSAASVPGFPGRICEYLRMRALGEPDAFPSADPELRKSSEQWHPWRAYAYMLLRTERTRPWRRHAPLDSADPAAVPMYGAR
jgi:AraC family transcriptional regulator of adaptative response / DNA-3-methyladenine glycosylase II